MSFIVHFSVRDISPLVNQQLVYTGRTLVLLQVTSPANKKAAVTPEHLFLFSFPHFFTSSVGFFSFFSWILQFLLLILQLFLHLLFLPIPTEEASPGLTHFVCIPDIVAFVLSVFHRSISSCFLRGTRFVHFEGRNEAESSAGLNDSKNADSDSFLYDAEML